jgi:hypothetical protein
MSVHGQEEAPSRASVGAVLASARCSGGTTVMLMRLRIRTARRVFPDPIARLRNPGSPHRGFFASAPLTGRHPTRHTYAQDRDSTKLGWAALCKMSLFFDLPVIHRPPRRSDPDADKTAPPLFPKGTPELMERSAARWLEGWLAGPGPPKRGRSGCRHGRAGKRGGAQSLIGYPCTEVFPGSRHGESEAGLFAISLIRGRYRGHSIFSISMRSRRISNSP